MHNKLVRDIIKLIICPYMIFGILYLLYQLKVPLISSLTAAWFFVPLIGYFIIGLLIAAMLNISDNIYLNNSFLYILLFQLLVLVCSVPLKIEFIYTGKNSYYFVAQLLGIYLYLLCKILRKRIDARNITKN